MKAQLDIHEFLRPLRIDDTAVHRLSHDFCQNFRKLAAESLDQFLPTPISESILRPTAGREKGRYLAIDIGGTNLRVGFIELLGSEKELASNGVNGHGVGQDHQPVRLRRQLEQSWPILEHLKSQSAESLFSWIGHCMAKVVREGVQEFALPADSPLRLGVTFSFPMIQQTLTDAMLMNMGKGFSIKSNVDLGSHLVSGYEKARTAALPPIQIAAIANDAVSTLVSFVYQSHEDETRKAAMGLICGTGSNATIPLKMSSLHPEKLPRSVKVLGGKPEEDTKIAVNTEWSINGSKQPLEKRHLITSWDSELAATVEIPGFQPLEYMTAGRYLGELGRLVLVDYCVNNLGYNEDALPAPLLQRFGLTTTFLSKFRPPTAEALISKLEAEYPTAKDSTFHWTEDIALALYEIAKAIETRAAGIIAASVVGLLACAGDIPLHTAGPQRNGSGPAKTEGEQQQSHHRNPVTLVVGYTGGCIAHFQDYRTDCQGFLDRVIEEEFGTAAPVRVELRPYHDGGITGAGVLCGATLS